MNDLEISKNKINMEPRGATRNHILNIVFQIPFYNKEELNNILETYYETLEYEKEIELKEDENFKIFKINKKIIENQLFNLVENLDKIDDIINKIAIGWSIERLDKIDLAILRLAIFEILFEEDIPNKVAINEAVEFAKKYSSEKSYKFINGILATIEKEK